MATNNHNQDIESRLRELTERTRKTREELEDLIRRSKGEHARGLSNDTPRFFRRRKSRDPK